MVNEAAAAAVVCAFGGVTILRLGICTYLEKAVPNTAGLDGKTHPEETKQVRTAGLAQNPQQWSPSVCGQRLRHHRLHRRPPLWLLLFLWCI